MELSHPLTPIADLISLTTSEITTYSASDVDNTTLLILLLFHATGNPQE